VPKSKNCFHILKRGENFNKILGTRKTSVNKEEIGFNSFNNKKCYKNFFVRSANYKSETFITYKYCCKIGHISTYCPIKRIGPRCIQILESKEPKPPNVN